MDGMANGAGGSGVANAMDGMANGGGGSGVANGCSGLEEKCSICHDELGDGTVQTECGHLYCGHCLDAWLKIEKRCPLCNMDVKLRALRELCPIRGGLIVEDGDAEIAATRQIAALRAERLKNEELAQRCTWDIRRMIAQREALEARVTRAAQNLPPQLAPAPTAKATLTAEQRAQIEAKRKEAQRRRAAAAQLQPALPHAQLTGQEGGGIESIAPMIAGQQRCTSPL